MSKRFRVGVLVCGAPVLILAGHTYPCTQDKTRLMSSNLKLLRRFFEYLDAAGSGSIGVRELEEPLISVVGSQAGAGMCRCVFDSWYWCW
jgi:hypothetical protein